jgi:hypothetical protein
VSVPARFGARPEETGPGGRLDDADPVLRRIDADLSGRPISTIRLDPATLVPRSRELVLAHHVRTLDAPHLAVALGLDAFADGDEIVLVTRDEDQASAARALGLSLL